MALLCGEIHFSILSESPLSRLPFLGLCFYLMLSLPLPPALPSLGLFTSLPLLLSLSPLSMRSMYDGASYTAGN